ncbi:peptidoglycan DD-metalloendopeptidase family protein [Paracnuella aquatica]|uniref:peptidoglycan DD-metalloendopeptidase family protein n=1 Tax=Paracnuella aquatica TaxID=2268757 RepID=UPI000DEF87F2|nr:peptidoglycan DD-metalloendopeptidase family protein [Paracnuella aquatica]RPD48191.1 M23 family metallopeptidase [Paracnuella aquatica]
MKNCSRAAIALFCLLLSCPVFAQNKYPQNYFRHPLNIPMELVANFGELRSNHWHMGLDIRTQQRENLQVFASAEGYVAKIKIEPGGFGRALYINHPNGLTTLYAHLNDFAPAIEQWVKAEQYKRQSWAVELQVPPQLFPVTKGQFIAYSGNTGGSQGPHVHFEIRDTRTDKCLNPLLFGFPLPDAVPPTISRLALYDRNRSVYHQTPQALSLKKTGAFFSLATGGVLRSASNRISFALTAIDRFTGYTNPNGVYCGRIWMDDVLQSEFVLDSIDYNETRYMNAHTDYRYKAVGGPWLQHLSRMPGDTTNVYHRTPGDGVLYLQDTATHPVRIEVLDAAGNATVVQFSVRYDPLLQKQYGTAPEQLVPGEVNVFERDSFELYTSEFALYDTVNVSFTQSNGGATGGLSPLYTFLSSSIPTHDSVTVRIRVPQQLPAAQLNKLVIKSVAGTRTVVEKPRVLAGWAVAKFRQFGTFQLLADTLPPTLPAPGPGAVVDARKLKRILFTPKDNMDKIASFRAEVNGQWLRFTNDKGRTWIYNFDEKFPAGESTLRVAVTDIAGNETVKEWRILR